MELMDYLTTRRSIRPLPRPPHPHGGHGGADPHCHLSSNRFRGTALGLFGAGRQGRNRRSQRNHQGVAEGEFRAISLAGPLRKMVHQPQVPCVQPGQHGAADLRQHPVSLVRLRWDFGRRPRSWPPGRSRESAAVGSALPRTFATTLPSSRTTGCCRDMSWWPPCPWGMQRNIPSRRNGSLR